MTSRILRIIFMAKYRMVNNAIEEMRRHLWIHVSMGLLVVLFLVGGGTGFFHFLFDFLNDAKMEPFGRPLLEHLIGMIFLAFFSMLVFSNIIITLSTTYISSELDFYMGLPVNHRSIFIVKTVESLIYSSWAFTILSLPIFMAFGRATDAPLVYYPLTILLVVPFLVIPAAIGAIVTTVVSASLPAGKARIITVAFIAWLIAAIVIATRLLGFRRLFSLSDMKDFGQIMNFLRTGNRPILPNYWLTRGILAAEEGRVGEWFYWFCILVSNALFFFQLCWWLVPKFYYRGWCLARETSSAGIAGSRFSILTHLERLLIFLPSKIRALVSKDIRTFWRDPAQWSQIIILFGLLFIYIANLRSAARYSGTVNIFLPTWQTLLSFFNLGATCFILSIITTRFIYPMLSLEGKQFWLVGLAPMNRSHIVWEKFWLSALSSLVVAEAMMIFSNYVLKTGPLMRYLSVGTVFLMSFCLTALSVGLGAISPDFREDNPARIANGFGGTMNVVLSLLYTGVIIALLMYPVYLDASGRRSLRSWPLSLAIPYMIIFILINIVVLVLPMKIGLRKWRIMEM